MISDVNIYICLSENIHYFSFPGVRNPSVDMGPRESGQTDRQRCQFTGKILLTIFLGNSKKIPSIPTMYFYPVSISSRGQKGLSQVY